MEEVFSRGFATPNHMETPVVSASCQFEAGVVEKGTLRYTTFN